MRFLHDHTVRGVCRDCCLMGLLAIPLIAGCGGGGGGSNGNPGTGTTTTGTSTAGNSTAGNNTSTQQPVTVSATTATGLTASITESNNTVAVGGSITYTLTLTNNNTVTIPIHATSIPPATPAATLIVKNSAGATIYQPNPPPAPAVFNGTIAPGQSLTTTVTVNGFAVAGVYNATATFDDDTTSPQTVGPLTVTAQ